MERVSSTSQPCSNAAYRSWTSGADFRLKNADDYAQWYRHEHAAPALLARSVYGLVERHREELPGATLIAVPGCYPTASALALGPFLDQRVVGDMAVDRERVERGVGSWSCTK